jgi:Transposase
VSVFSGEVRDQKNHIVLRSGADPKKVQHQVITQQPDALHDWVGEMQQRFGAKGKILVCLEQSRGVLIYHLMGYELFELYPINPGQLAHYRAAFASSGAKDDRPDADLLCELIMNHRDRLKSKPGNPIRNSRASWPLSMRAVARPSMSAPGWPTRSRASSKPIFLWRCRSWIIMRPRRFWRPICCCYGWHCPYPRLTDPLRCLAPCRRAILNATTSPLYARRYTSGWIPRKKEHKSIAS